MEGVSKGTQSAVGAGGEAHGHSVPAEGLDSGLVLFSFCLFFRPLLRLGFFSFLNCVVLEGRRLSVAGAGAGAAGAGLGGPRCQREWR